MSPMSASPPRPRKPGAVGAEALTAAENVLLRGGAAVGGRRDTVAGQRVEVDEVLLAAAIEVDVGVPAARGRLRAEERARRRPRRDRAEAVAAVDRAEPDASLRAGSGRTAHEDAPLRIETDVRPMGRAAYGVRGITLRDDDVVVAMEVVEPGGTLLTVTERGYGKRTEMDEYRVQSRGGVGVINISTSTRNGQVVGVSYVEEGDEVLLITQQGMIIRMPTNDVRSIGRATQGVRLIEIEGDDRVVSVARLVEKEENGEEEPPAA